MEDQGSPGKDGCDVSKAPMGDDFNLLLGYDCKVRERDGNVVAEVPANRSDGTCGQLTAVGEAG